MIEIYFEKGFTYTWNPPQKITTDPHDGSIFRSGTSHPPNLTYTGLHPGFFDGVTLPSTRGIATNTAIRYRWLNYVHGRTAYVRSTNTDVLTGFMSGCWICSWSEHGHRRVGHIGTVDFAARDAAPNSTVKQAFAASPAMQVGSHIRGYNPADAWDVADILRLTNQTKIVTQSLIMSLVNTRNEFYSILMMQTIAPGKWICGGKKRVHGHHRGTLQAALA
ncbi:hypothetical protein [Roseibium sp.]|uniref:hypothetical protein n=1 Tax=Roseibium sp. TaxID=1936156 RepID=UPI003D14F1E0